MAQTKRKRRNKHRGNAAGMVEARGRTSKPNPDAPKRSASGGRTAPKRPQVKPPTWQAAAAKAAFGALILFAFLMLTQDNEVGQTITLCLFAVVLYTPIMYMTDKWIYGRKVKMQKR